jgi:hypothetical protein
MPELLNELRAAVRDQDLSYPDDLDCAGAAGRFKGLDAGPAPGVRRVAPR